MNLNWNSLIQNINSLISVKMSIMHLFNFGYLKSILWKCDIFLSWHGSCLLFKSFAWFLYEKSCFGLYVVILI